jgi:hypothetical protein
MDKGGPPRPDFPVGALSKGHVALPVVMGTAPAKRAQVRQLPGMARGLDGAGRLRRKHPVAMHLPTACAVARRKRARVWVSQDRQIAATCGRNPSITAPPRAGT